MEWPLTWYAISLLPSQTPLPKNLTFIFLLSHELSALFLLIICLHLFLLPYLFLWTSVTENNFAKSFCKKLSNQWEFCSNRELLNHPNVIWLMLKNQQEELTTLILISYLISLQNSASYIKPVCTNLLGVWTQHISEYKWTCI